MQKVLTTSFQLRRKIIHDGQTYAVLTMREALVSDRLAVDGLGLDQAELEIALVAHLCDVPVGVIREMALVDYGNIQKALMDFPYPPEPVCEMQSAASPAPSGDSL